MFSSDSGSGLKGFSLQCLSMGLCTGVLFTCVGAAAAGLAAIAAGVVVLGAKRGRGIPHAVDTSVSFFTAYIARMPKWTGAPPVTKPLVVKKIAGTLALCGDPVVGRTAVAVLCCLPHVGRTVLWLDHIWGWKAHLGQLGSRLGLLPIVITREGLLVRVGRGVRLQLMFE